MGTDRDRIQNNGQRVQKSKPTHSIHPQPNNPKVQERDAIIQGIRRSQRRRSGSGAELEDLLIKGDEQVKLTTQIIG